MKIRTKVSNVTMLLFIGLIVSFSSCETNVEEETIVEDMQQMEEEETCEASFADDVNPIIESKCLSCHSGTQFPDLRTYQGVSSNAGIVKTQVVNRTMPIGGTLTNAEIELISCWVDNGAPNN